MVTLGGKRIIWNNWNRNRKSYPSLLILWTDLMDLLFLLSTHLDSLLFVVVLINLQNIEIFENNNTLTDLCIKLPLTLFRLGGGLKYPQHYIFTYQIRTVYTEQFKPFLSFRQPSEKIIFQIWLDCFTYYYFIISNIMVCSS